MQYKRYKNELEYSYALGMAPVIELIRHRLENVLAIYVHPDYKAGIGIGNGCGAEAGTEARSGGRAEAGIEAGSGSRAGGGCGAGSWSGADIFDICKSRSLPCEINQKIFNIAANKENIYVIGVFKKPSASLTSHQPHAVFVNPADAGNLGANLRTCLGFGIRSAAIIRPGADAFSPKAVRASMGAIFQMNAAEFSSYGEYSAAYPEHEKFCFMLDGETELGEILAIDNERFSLIFGNEATGLPAAFQQYGRSVRIPHSDAIDSLNITVAVGIAAHAFYNLRQKALS